jgi:hypothetical protein
MATLISNVIVKDFGIFNANLTDPNGGGLPPDASNLTGFNLTAAQAGNILVDNVHCFGWGTGINVGTGEECCFSNNQCFINGIGMLVPIGITNTKILNPHISYAYDGMLVQSSDQVTIDGGAIQGCINNGLHIQPTPSGYGASGRIEKLSVKNIWFEANNNSGSTTAADVLFDASTETSAYYQYFSNVSFENCHAGSQYCPMVFIRNPIIGQQHIATGIDLLSVIDCQFLSGATNIVVPSYSTYASFMGSKHWGITDNGLQTIILNCEPAGGGPTFQIPAIYPWHTLLDIDFVAQTPQTFNAPGNYTFGGKTWTMINTNVPSSGPSIQLTSNGLQIFSNSISGVGAPSMYTNGSGTCQMVRLPLSQLFGSTSYDYDTKLRISVSYSRGDAFTLPTIGASPGTWGDSAFFGIDAQNGNILSTIAQYGNNIYGIGETGSQTWGLQLAQYGYVIGGGNAVLSDSILLDLIVGGGGSYAAQTQCVTFNGLGQTRDLAARIAGYLDVSGGATQDFPAQSGYYPLGHMSCNVSNGNTGGSLLSNLGIVMGFQSPSSAVGSWCLIQRLKVEYSY